MNRETTMSQLLSATALVAFCAALAAPAHAAISRTYVASYGSDANVGFSCNFANPCRTFQAAFSQVTDGGEILAVDGSGYGPITINRSVSVIANPGVFAGVGAFTGAAITVAAPGINVTLRGLTINGQGGSYGVSMTNGTRLSIENCVIANFAVGSGAALSVTTPATVRIVDSIIRDNYYGVFIQNGATADISASKFLGNSYAIYSSGTAAGTTTAAISDTVISGSSVAGIMAHANNAAAITRIGVIRAVVTNGADGVVASSAAGTASVILSESMVTGNSLNGLSQSGAGATFTSLVNNTVAANGSNTSGTISTTTPL
jgi:hypothetical protein